MAVAAADQHRLVQAAVGVGADLADRGRDVAGHQPAAPPRGAVGVAGVHEPAVVEARKPMFQLRAADGALICPFFLTLPARPQRMEARSHSR